MEKIVDARGIACPQPVLMTKEALKDMTEGAVKVLVDNETAVQNVTKMAKHLGFEPKSEKTAENEFTITIPVDGNQTVQAAGASNEESEECECCSCEDGNDDIKKGLVVVLSSDQMGGGSEELGKALMKGFVVAVTKLDRLPETILLYNGGAKLAVEGSDSLADLKALEEQGVEILTCGTCLNFYGITDQLGVGNVTNMYEIAEKLTGAKSIVKP